LPLIESYSRVQITELQRWKRKRAKGSGHQLMVSFGRAEGVEPWPRYVRARCSVTFPQTYPTTPKLLFGLSRVDADGSRSWSLSLAFPEINASSFSVHMAAFDGARGYSIGCNWLTLPNDLHMEAGMVFAVAIAATTCSTYTSAKASRRHPRSLSRSRSSSSPMAAFYRSNVEPRKLLLIRSISASNRGRTEPSGKQKCSTSHTQWKKTASELGLTGPQYTEVKALMVVGIRRLSTNNPSRVRLRHSLRSRNWTSIAPAICASSAARTHRITKSLYGTSTLGMTPTWTTPSVNGSRLSELKHSLFVLRPSLSGDTIVSSHQ
jgi:hypothetical protein